jgi:hypothetical protein
MPKNIVQIDNSEVNGNIQKCANWPTVISEAEATLGMLKSRLRNTRENIQVVHKKVLAEEPFPVRLKGWSWNRVLSDMEVTLRDVGARAKHLNRAIRLAKSAMAAGEPCDDLIPKRRRA